MVSTYLTWTCKCGGTHTSIYCIIIKCSYQCGKWSCVVVELKAELQDRWSRMLRSLFLRGSEAVFWFSRHSATRIPPTLEALLCLIANGQAEKLNEFLIECGSFIRPSNHLTTDRFNVENSTWKLVPASDDKTYWNKRGSIIRHSIQE